MISFPVCIAIGSAPLWTSFHPLPPLHTDLTLSIAAHVLMTKLISLDFSQLFLFVWWSVVIFLKLVAASCDFFNLLGSEWWIFHQNVVSCDFMFFFEFGWQPVVMFCNCLAVCGELL